MIKIFKEIDIQKLEDSVNEFLYKNGARYSNMYFSCYKYVNQVFYVIVLEGVYICKN